MTQPDPELDEIISEAMQGGFDSAMAGTPLNTDQENEDLQNKFYSQTMAETKQRFLAWRDKIAWRDKMVKIMEDNLELAEILEVAKTQTNSDDPFVHICWLIQGLSLGNYSLEETQRYVVSNVKVLRDKAVREARIEELKQVKMRSETIAWSRGQTFRSEYIEDRLAQLQPNQDKEK